MFLERRLLALGVLLHNAIRQSIAAGLKDAGYYNRMDEETKGLFAIVFEKKGISSSYHSQTKRLSVEHR